ncbi:ATP synthase, F1 complex, delta subunit [Campylobacter iguaniorum]|uniref:ATP synthase subunit delta n=1 Tax=Campylobacter iguaniorum TaxID=1244531 RepID=A0A076FBG3_9BACT|nr:F0F1 ATP synthase subunit delta [Campylobacter iguaniorum]AII15301.1 ATP synthase, F1 complex, delta subunit [Campylobacter iguaniorum]ALV25227.1 ATP synthase, F1 complex, delta subunit [Campylobacter iguaniorum]
MKEVVAKKYVKALIASLNSDEFDRVESALVTLASAFKIEKLKVILDSPDIDGAKKANFVYSLLDNGSDKIRSFISLLGDNKRLALIPEISKEFSYQKSIRDNAFTGLISGSFELNQNQQAQLEEKFSSKFGSKIDFEKIKNDYNGIKIELDDLGVEVSFSIDRLKAQMSEYILKAI